jgi:imidazolonepropionase-like amidohydrolase
MTPDTAKMMAEQDAFLVPTLIVYHVNKMLGRESGKSASSLEKNEKVYSAGFEALEHCRAAGVQIGFGTDLSMHTQQYQCEGLSLQARVMPNADVIRSATIVNAEIVRQAGKLGELLPGAKADLLVIEGDPYCDLGVFDSNGSKIKAVMKDGRFFKNVLSDR